MACSMATGYGRSRAVAATSSVSPRWKWMGMHSEETSGLPVLERPGTLAGLQARTITFDYDCLLFR
jgi:hypothetical protein